MLAYSGGIAYDGLLLHAAFGLAYRPDGLSGTDVTASFLIGWRY